jgi:hypothetical protein
LLRDERIGFVPQSAATARRRDFASPMAVRGDGDKGRKTLQPGRSTLARGRARARARATRGSTAPVGVCLCSL